jgi:flagellin-like protein
MKKGISPLIAVIMLIAFTMIVAAILAVWAQNYAQAQTQQMQICIDSGLYIHTARWIPGVSPDGELKVIAKNTGQHDLTFTVILEYENETRHPDIVEVVDEDGDGEVDTYNITVNEFRTITVSDVSDDLKEASIRSVLCGDFGIYDMVGKNYISGLPR